ncbi:Helicase HerA, central domain [anaerobic digester metagenome]
MNENILKIGEVIEVKGQKVRAKVYQDKNTSTLNYKGKIIKNISVGSFVKIRKNFLDIIGKVEGEYVNDKTVKEEYAEKNNSINRVIEISIVGRIEDIGTFKRGLSELPLISNYVYILKDSEVQKIFSFVSENAPVIELGDISAYEQYKLLLGVQSLFGSHIGIFGNTGSGKSNTLAKIYTELFNMYGEIEAFKKNSKFVLIDFNGEYAETITENKNVILLSTREKKDTYNLDENDIQDLEFWSIILEATEKTQQPFLKRAINQYKYLIRHSVNANNTNNVIQEKTIELVQGLFDFGYKYNSVKRYYEEIINVSYHDIDEPRDAFFNNITFNATTGSWYNIGLFGTKEYRNTEEEFKENPAFIKLIEKLKLDECKIHIGDKADYWAIFEFAMKYQYVYDVQRGYVNEEHIAPIIRRLDTRLDDMNKVFSINENNNNPNNISIVSLIDVNIYMRKIVPMLICKKEYDKHKKQNLHRRNKALYIIVDEAHNILSKESERESSAWKDYRIEVFEEIIKEGRKFGVFLTIASQRPSDISDTIISQLHNYFLHRLVNSEDIKAIGKTVSFLDAASFEMIPILQQGACVVTGTACNFPVIVQVDILNDKKRPKSNTIDLHASWTE